MKVGERAGNGTVFVGREDVEVVYGDWGDIIFRFL